VAFSPDGKKVAVGADNGAAGVYDAESGEKLWLFMAPRNSFHGVDFLDEKTLVSTGDDTMGSDGKSLLSALRLWDVSDRGVVLPGAAKGMVKRVTVEDTGRATIVTGSGEILVGFGPAGRLHEGANSESGLGNLPTEYAETLEQATWLKGARTGLALSQDKSADSWQVLKGGGHPKVKFYANDLNELELRVLLDDRRGTGSKSAHLRTLRGHHARLVAAGMSPNGRFIVSVDESGRCLGWDLLRPAVCRDYEKKLGMSRDAEEVADLRNWFTFRGREDLASAVK
jgi:WD40 repeat protein